MELVKKGITAKDIVTKKSFENAIMVHAAISGSTNATMHLPAIAHEFGIEIDADTFDRMHRGAHYLLNIRPSGDWPAQYFYYAGGVPRVMEEIKSMLHLDVMTVTGKTLGENLEELKKNGFYQHCDAILAEKTAGFARPVSREDIIHSFDNAKGTDGSIAILKGNLAPEGCVIKHTACPKNMFEATLRAKPYDSEEECISAVLHGEVKPGDAAVVTIGTFNSGTRWNVIAGEARLTGTVRTLRPETAARMPEAVGRIAATIAASRRAEAVVRYEQKALPTVNDPAVTQVARGAALKVLGPDALYEIGPSMVGEDFCHFAAGAPGCMGLLGVRNEACGAVYGQHHSSYTVDENALSGGVAMYVQTAIDLAAR